MGITGQAQLYSVAYDGSLITNDDRDVERNTSVGAGAWGLNYYYHKFFAVHVYFQVATDLLKEESIPNPPPGKDKTHGDISYGALIIDFHF